MDLSTMLLLAIVQGITEFLPISSDGHLVMAANLLQVDTSQFGMSDVTIALHIGTLGSIIVYYFRRLMKLLGEDRKLILPLMVGTIPAVLLGLPIKMFCEGILESTLLTGLMLPLTGVLLILGSRFGSGTLDYRDVSLKQAWLIGCAQAAAIMPGLSRSGCTISSGLALGLKRESAATFSFLLAVPAIAGAGVLETLKFFVKKDAVLSSSPTNLAIGMAVSFVVGIGAIWLLVRLLERGYVRVFAWYCIVVGGLFFGWSLWQWLGAA